MRQHQIQDGEHLITCWCNYPPARAVPIRDCPDCGQEIHAPPSGQPATPANDVPCPENERSATTAGESGIRPAGNLAGPSGQPATERHDFSKVPICPTCGYSSKVSAFATADPVEALIVALRKIGLSLVDTEHWKQSDAIAVLARELESALRASRTAGGEPWLFAIEEQSEDGTWSWHDGEQCVFGDRESAEDEVDELNDSVPDGHGSPYRIVPLYRALLAAGGGVEGLSLESATTIGEEVIKEYQRLQKEGYTHWCKSNIGRMIQAGVRAALAASASPAAKESKNPCTHTFTIDGICQYCHEKIGTGTVLAVNLPASPAKQEPK